MYKKFFVSKSDENKLNFIKKAINKIKPSNVFILVEESRKAIYQGIDGVVLPLKELNKNVNWLNFSNSYNADSLLVIDNVLKFIFYGDGKKAYLKDISQSIKNIIVTDVVPFYSEPHEIFYPLWFLGKEILGYNSYNSFKANHLEEKKDGSIDFAHSFDVLYEKIKNNYIQDYPDFFINNAFTEFSMNESEVKEYEKKRDEAKADFTNPIKFYNDVSPVINMCQSRYDAINKLLATLDLSKTVLVNNSASFQVLHKKRIPYQVDYLTFHSDLSEFEKYENVVFMQMPIVKPMNFYYIVAQGKKYYQITLIDNKLEMYYQSKIYNNDLRKQIDAAFYNAYL